MAAPDEESVFLEQHEEDTEEKKGKLVTKTVELKKPHLCPYPGCKARYTTPSKLDRHYCMHTGEVFICH